MPTPFRSRNSSEHSGTHLGTPLSGRIGSIEVKNPIDWNTNVVNFISSCRHPGLVRRTSSGTAHAQDPSLPRKTHHRRNLSAVTTLGFQRHPDTPHTLHRVPPYNAGFYPQRNNFNSVAKHSMCFRLPPYGHTRNISDPTACWEQCQLDSRRMAPTLYFEPTVYPVLSLSRQLSVTTPEEPIASDELRHHAYPYLPTSLTEHPAWEEIGDVEQIEETLPDQSETAVIEGGKYLSPCLQAWATPVAVLCGLSFITFIQTMVSTGLISSMLTTLEQRFNFTSRQMGYMISCLEGSAVLTTVAVSFINGRKHNRLRVVGFATLIFSFGFALFTLPHFLIGPYEPEIRNLPNTEIKSPSMLDMPKTSSRLNHTHSSVTDGSSLKNADHSTEVLIFYVSMLLAGIGGSPIYVLAPTYLWDNLSAKQYPIYSAIFYSAGGLGPACGFLAGAGFLSVFIDYPFREAPPGFTRNDPLWLGNWWLGILICAAVSFIAACPVMTFPKRLGSTHVQKKCPDDTKQNMASDSHQTTLPHPTSNKTKSNYSLQRLYDFLSSRNRPDWIREPPKSNERTSSESALTKNSPSQVHRSNRSDLRRVASVGCCPRKSESSEACPMTLKRLPVKAEEQLKSYLLVLRRVLANPIWFGVTFTSVVEHSIVAAFLTFVSKYIQGLFQVPAYLASIHTGAVVVPSSLLGVISGALIMRNYRPRIDRALLGITAVIGATIATTTTLMLLGCSSNRMAGVTATYDGRHWPWAYGPVRLADPNLTAPCNTHHSFHGQLKGATECSSEVFDPVCWSYTDLNGAQEYMTFFNPCFAGCPSTGNSGSSSAQSFYDNCTCVTDNSLNPFGSVIFVKDPYAKPGRVSAGRCTAQCPQYPLFLVMLFLHVLLTGILQNPSNVITLSCVAPEDSSVALGLQVFLLRTIAYIPAPIYFGNLFDFVCQYRMGPASSTAIKQSVNTSLLSHPNATTPSPLSHTFILPGQSSSGACLQYNLDGLPLVWLGVVLGLKITSLIGAIFTWHIARLRTVKTQLSDPPSDATGSPSASIKRRVVTVGVQSLPSLREPHIDSARGEMGYVANPSA